jgi:hypothetical protein
MDTDAAKDNTGPEHDTKLLTYTGTKVIESYGSMLVTVRRNFSDETLWIRGIVTLPKATTMANKVGGLTSAVL